MTSAASAASRGAAVVTLPTDDEILITRAVGAPKHLVYRAYTSLELLPRWWSASRGEMTVVEGDLRVGGRYRYAMLTSTGTEFAIQGEYLHVAPNDRLVFTEAFEAAVPPINPTVTVTFTEVKSGTSLTVLVKHPNRESRDRHFSSGMADGIQDVLDDLEQVAISLR